MAGPTVFHRADQLGSVDTTTKSKESRIHTAAVEPGFAVLARKSAALAGSFLRAIGGRIIAGHWPGVGDAHPGGRFVFQRNRSPDWFAAFPDGTGAGR